MSADITETDEWELLTFDLDSMIGADVDAAETQGSGFVEGGGQTARGRPFLKAVPCCRQ